MAGIQISTSVSIIDNLHGFMALSLTEYNTSAAAAIAAGSVVEIAGAFFTFAGDETPTGWSSISTGSTAYIALTASGTAGSQIVTASYTSTAPTWRDDLQGWYASAASSVRIVASVYKAEATSYYPKYVLDQYQSSNHLDKLKVLESIDSNTVSASSSMTIAGSTVRSYKITSESYLKSSASAYTFYQITTSSSVVTLISSYVITSGSPTYISPTAQVLTSGSLYLSAYPAAGTPPTNYTFYITYWY